MRPSTRQKNGDFLPNPSHLTLHQGGLAHRPTARQLLDRAQTDIAASCKRDAVANSTAYPSRAVADMANLDRKPLRIVARIIADELRGGGPTDFGVRLGHALILFTEQEAAAQGRKPVSENADDDRRAA